MANPSLGLTVSIPPEMAARLRQDPSSQATLTPDATEASPATPQSETKSASLDANDNEKKKDDTLPCISINLERLIGYLPEPDELESIHSQLVTAMWTRYREQSHPVEEERRQENAFATSTSQPPPDFDAQVLELLDSGVARFSISKTTNGDNYDDSAPFILLPYPPRLESPATGEHIATRRLVQRLQQPPIIVSGPSDPDAPPSTSLDFVLRLWQHLQVCSRSLFWKCDMANELNALLREEQARLEYDEWTSSKRQPKLDNLYSIRETLVHQVELAQAKVEILEDELGVQVQEAMEPIRRRIQQQQRQQNTNGVLDGFGTTQLSFPDDFQWLGLQDANVVDPEEDWGLNEDEDSYGNSESDSEGCSSSRGKLSSGDDADKEDNLAGKGDDDGAQASLVDEVISAAEGNSAALTIFGVGQTPATVVSQRDSEDDPPKATVRLETGDSGDPPKAVVQLDADDAGELLDDAASGEQPSLSVPFQRRKERRDKTKRRKRQERKNTKEKTKQEELIRMEQEFTRQFTSKELILAQTMSKALEEKMEKVEALLESLQDEVWEAEEDSEQNTKMTDASISTPSVSLLDQVLAMILGALPVDNGMSSETHYHFVQNEHTVIVKAWKSHFGRLPPPAGDPSAVAPSGSQDGISQPNPREPSSTPSEQRKELGIEDNEADDWDAVEDWDDLLLDKKLSKEKVSAAPPAPPRKESTDTFAAQPPTPRPTLVGLRPGGSLGR